MKKELIGAIKENRLMDFMGANYYKFSKEELKTIILELEYSFHKASEDNGFKRDLSSMINELEDRL